MEDVKLEVYLVCPKCGKETHDDIDSYDVSACVDDCEMCGSHGTVEIDFNCQYCGARAEYELKDW